MRLGAVFPQGELGPDPAVDDVLAFVAAVEAAGYDHLLVFDHVVGADSTARPGWAGAYDHTHPFLEPLVLFGLLAGACGLELVTDVLVLPQRQTVLVAKQVATLETLAPGRIRLGVGIGWNDVEYDALGIDPRTRGARVDEQIPLLRRLWSEPTLTHAGRHDRVDRAGIAPQPRRVPPIWIGSTAAPPALDRVARLADGWLPMPNLQPGHGFEDAWTIVTGRAAEVGRAGVIGLEGHVAVRPDTVERAGERLGRWHDVGADAVAVNTLRHGARWPDGHLDLLRRAVDQAR